MNHRPHRGSADDSTLQQLGALVPDLRTWSIVRVRPELRRHLDPEDLVQEILLHAQSSLDRFDPTAGELRAWVFGIAHHVLAASLRQLGRQRREPGGRESSILRGVVRPQTSIPSRAARHEVREGFHAALMGLPEADRELIALRALEQLDFDEVAAVLGIGVKAARSRWERLIARMRRSKELARLVD